MFDTMPSPIGTLMMIADGDEGLREIRFLGTGSPAAVVFFCQGRGIYLSRNVEVLKPVGDQLTAYFQKRLTVFNLNVAPHGTPFQRLVWSALGRIPYGQTRSYRQIAEHIGNPKACRAVGRANAANPIPIVIPCHRVIGADGALTGFGGGLDVKARLLELEGACGSETPG